MKFNVGDRVRKTSHRNFDDKGSIGAFGTVIGSNMVGNTNHFCVEFDDFIDGHDGNDTRIKGKYGHCWWFYDGDGLTFEIIKKNTNKIVITSDGVETLARLYDGNKVIKTATAKCSPDDDFDFATGAKIAFNRLIGEKAVAEEKPKYFNGKAVCIKTKPFFSYTVGKVYEFNDGFTVIDNGNRVCDSVSSIDEWNEKYGCYVKMLEIVE